MDESPVVSLKPYKRYTFKNMPKNRTKSSERPKKNISIILASTHEFGIISYQITSTYINKMMFLHFVLSL